MAGLRTQQVRRGLYLQSPRPASPFKGHQNFGNQRRNLDPPQRFTELSICLAASGEHGLERRPGMLEWRCLWNKISTPHCQQLEKIKEEDYFENCSTKKKKENCSTIYKREKKITIYHTSNQFVPMYFCCNTWYMYELVWMVESKSTYINSIPEVRVAHNIIEI